MHSLLRVGVRLGVITPSNIYTDNGSTTLRTLFLDRCRWEWLFGFENREGIFDIHRSFKFCPLVIAKGGQTTAIRTAFMRRQLAGWENAERHVLAYPRAQMTKFSPRSRVILELCSPRDAAILEKMYAHGVLLGDDSPRGWELKCATEFHMTNDSRLFPPRPTWEAQGYAPDEYGHWLKGAWRPISDFKLPISNSAEAWSSPHVRARSVLQRAPGLSLSRDGTRAVRVAEIDDVALPIYEGRMLDHYDFSAKGWVSGRGRSAVWRDIPWEQKVIEPQFVISRKDQDEQLLKKYLEAFQKRFGKDAAEREGLRLGNPEDWTQWREKQRCKVGFMDISSATNSRTMIAAFLDDAPCGNKVPTLGAELAERSQAALILSQLLCSLGFDFQMRQRLGGLTINYFVIEETCLPAFHHLHPAARTRMEIFGLQLNCPHIAFAAEWEKREPILDSHHWQGHWAISDGGRIRVASISTALACQVYGLDFDDLLWILRDCNHPRATVGSDDFTRTLDPKGFWRVDKEKDPELRHTVLSLVAFHDLQRLGLDAFLAQNNGEGWMLPDTLRLSDYGLGHDARAREPQPVAARLGPRFYPWQLEGTVETRCSGMTSE